MTGASGRIGRAVVAALAADPEVDEVVALDVAAPDAPLPLGVRHLIRDTRDPRLVDNLDGVDALVHLAFRVLDRREAERVNVDGSRNVFDGAVAAGVRVIVHASSGAVYGGHADNPVPLKEDRPLRPAAFAYPETKVRVERLLEALSSRTSDTRAVWLRASTTLGPGAPLLLGRSALVRLADFDPPTQFTWVDDVASAFVCALHAREARGAFNVGASGTVRSSEIAGILGVRDVAMPYRPRRALAAAMTLARLPGALHPGFVDMARYPIVVDAGRAHRELGWRPRLDTLATLRRFGELIGS